MKNRLTSAEVVKNINTQIFTQWVLYRLFTSYNNGYCLHPGAQDDGDVYHNAVGFKSNREKTPYGELTLFSFSRLKSFKGSVYRTDLDHVLQEFKNHIGLYFEGINEELPDVQYEVTEEGFVFKVYRKNKYIVDPQQTK